MRQSVLCALVALPCAIALVAAGSPYTDVFINGEQAPGLPSNFTYGFQIPVLQRTPGGALLAFAQAYMRIDDKLASPPARLGSGDGNDAWIDIVMRRSEDEGETWGDLVVLCRNSTGIVASKTSWHACQQPAPVADARSGRVFLLTSLDNWHMRMLSSDDDGRTFTPWARARDLDADLRRPGWGLVFTGLPGGTQLVAPNAHAGRLVICSSAYWSGGALKPDGSIAKPGDNGSRWSYSIVSDDAGATWRLGSDRVGPMHTTECSFAQSHGGHGDLYMYTRIWNATQVGVPFRRGLARSVDGGGTFENASLYGMGDGAPDCEGSFASAPWGAGTGVGTCFFVSAPHSSDRANLTLQWSCVAGDGAPEQWNVSVVDSGASSYSALAMLRGEGEGDGEGDVYRVLDLYAFNANGTGSPNSCLYNTSCDGESGIRSRVMRVAVPPPPLLVHV